jgi:hypothetical protein
MINSNRIHISCCCCYGSAPAGRLPRFLMPAYLPAKRRKNSKPFSTLPKERSSSKPTVTGRRWAWTGYTSLLRAAIIRIPCFSGLNQTMWCSLGWLKQNRLNRFWDPKKIPDEPVRQKNTRGTIAFARDLKDTRCAQLFVNMANNRKLDTTMRNGVKGFVPIARVVQGMIIISSFNAAYKKRAGDGAGFAV